MRKICLISSIVALFAMTFQSYAQLGTSHLLYPGVTEINRVYHAPYTATPPVIDGDCTDAVWDLAPWRIAQTYTPLHADWNNGTPVSPEGAFTGVEDLKFEWKMLWDNDHYYLLMKHVDDQIIYSDIHNGYPGSGNKWPPDISPTPTLPAVGGGNGSVFHSWRMDHISLWMTYWNQAFYYTAYDRNNNGVLHSFYPGAIHSAESWSVLWAAKHVGGETHVGTAGGKHVEGTNERYIEFKDSGWGTMFVNNPGFSVSAGDTLLFGGEINEADGVTNRRDYFLTISTEDGNGWNPLFNQTLIILDGPTDAPGKYYVSADGDDTNPGNSPGAPWKTIDKAINHSYQTGDDVYFRCGDTFIPSTSFNITWQGTVDDPAVIGAYYLEEGNVVHGVNENGKPVLSGNNYRVPDNTCYGTADSWQGLINIHSKDYIHVKDITLLESGFYGLSLVGDLIAGTNSSHFLIKNVSIEGSYNSGIAIVSNFINHGVIENCEITRTGYRWKAGYGTPSPGINIAHCPFSNTTIRNNYLYEIWGQGINIWTNSNYRYKNHGHVLVEDNILWNIRTVAIQVEKAEHTIVRRNICLGAGPDVQNNDFFFSNLEGRGWNDYGIRVSTDPWSSDPTGITSSYLKNVEVSNNLIANYRTGIEFGSYHQVGERVMENIFFYNNTLTGNFNNIFFAELLSDYTMNNVHFKNNISFAPSDCFSSDFEDQLSWHNEKISFSHNAWKEIPLYVNNENDVIFDGKMQKTTGWQDLTEVVPAEYFALTEGSNAINAGLNLSSIVTHDFFGYKRPSAGNWDMGAIMSDPSVRTEAPVHEPGNLHVYPNPVKSNINVEFEVSESSKVSLTLYNIQGQEITVLLNRQMQPGGYNKQFTIEGLPEGLYILKLQTGHKSEVRQVAVMK